MPKLFFMLLAAARGARIYLRSVLRSAAGLVSRLGKAPGSNGGAELDAEARMGAGMANRAASDSRLDAQADAFLTGRMVAWLVSVAYSTFHAGLAMLHTILSGAPGSGMGKDAQPRVDLTAGADTGPGMPGAFPGIREDGMEAGAVTAPPVPMKAPQEWSLPVLIAGSAAEAAAIGAGCLDYSIWMECGAVNGPFASIRGLWPQHTGLNAQMMTWSAPEWVDEKTLYIRQVYETERDGDTLILH